MAPLSVAPVWGVGGEWGERGDPGIESRSFAVLAVVPVMACCLANIEKFKYVRSSDKAGVIKV